MKKHTLYVRRQILINTDPQRRCYNGCFAKSELIWTDWVDLFDSNDLEDLKLTMKTFQSINPTHEYKIELIKKLP